MATEDHRFNAAAREEAKALARAEAQVLDGERMIARQRVLLEEIRSGGQRTVEAESSLVRLEAALDAFRQQRDGLLEKAQQRIASAGSAPTQLASPVKTSMEP